jgi:hypothetical protein
LLSQLIHPGKVKPLLQWKTLNQYKEPLSLNYHLAAIEYFGQTNNYEDASSSFNCITNHYKSKSLTIKDEIKLCLFFNRWSRFDLTISMLFERMNDSDFTEDAAFILAQTVAAYPYNINYEDQVSVISNAFRHNRKRWCDWIQIDFQNLRFESIKKIYCESCE